MSTPFLHLEKNQKFVPRADSCWNAASLSHTIKLICCLKQSVFCHDQTISFSLGPRSFPQKGKYLYHLLIELVWLLWRHGIYTCDE